MKRRIKSPEPATQVEIIHSTQHAKDIPDATIYALVRAGISTRAGLHSSLSVFPAKVVDAKLRQMVKSGRLNGCAARCNCRGDFSLPI